MSIGENANQDEAPRAKGRAVRRTEPDLDRLATVSDEDVAEAMKLWKEFTPPPLATLLDAESELRQR